MSNERDRINFMIERDGMEAAVKWAEQTRSIYFKASMEQSRFGDSIKELEVFLEEQQGDQFRSWKKF
jgi:hypothetical protein